MRKAAGAARAVGAALFLGAVACEGARGAGVRDEGAQEGQAAVAVHVTSARAGTPTDFEVVESRGIQRSTGGGSRTPADFTVAARNAVFSTTFRAAANSPGLQVDVVVREGGRPIKLTAQGRVVTVRRSAPGERVSIVSGADSASSGR